MPEIYLDNETATPPYSPLIDKLSKLYKENFASVHSLHVKGQVQIPLLNEAFSALYSAVGAKKEDQFLFCENGEIAINQAIFAAYNEGTRASGKNHFLSSQAEGNAILHSIKRLEKFGCALKFLPLNSYGQITKEALEDFIGPRTCMLSLSWAHGLTGVIQPIQEISDLCKEKGIYLHVDASHVIGKQYFRFQDYSINFLSFSGDTLHAPKGTGGLFIKEGTPFNSLILGPSELNTPLITVMSEAFLQTTNNFEHLCTETARLRDLLEKMIKEEISDAEILFQKAERLPNTSVISFPGIISESLLYLLNKKGVYASMGGGALPLLSQVLKSYRMESSLTNSALSFSLSISTSEEEIERAAKIIIECAKQLRTKIL